jgi:nucleoid-associated protein YgaU
MTTKKIYSRAFPARAFLILALATGFSSAVGLVGCSTGQDSAPENADAVPAADAGTDAVPQAAVEDPNAPPTAPVADAAPPAPSDPNAAAPPAPTDANAAPAAPADQAAAAPAPAAPIADAAPVAPAMDPAPAPAAPVADAAPAAPASPTSSGDMQASSGGSDSYTVQKGDTLMKIAFETYGDLYKWKDIYDANRDSIKDPNAVPPGTVLKMDKPSTPVALERNGDQYLIKKGDTLGTISNDVYGTTAKWKRLWENNKQLIKNPNRIYAGFYLFYTLTPEEREQFDKKSPAQPKPLAEDDSQPAAPQQQAAQTQGVTAPPPPSASAPGQPTAMTNPAQVRTPSSVGGVVVAKGPQVARGANDGSLDLNQVVQAGK